MSGNERRYSSEEVGQIVRHGLRDKAEDTIGYDELMEIGREFGLDTDDIHAAIESHEESERRELRAQRRRAGFTSHLYSYLGVNALLILINLLTPGPWWVQWPILGWGIGLFFHYRGVQAALKRSN